MQITIRLIIFIFIRFGKWRARTSAKLRPLLIYLVLGLFTDLEIVISLRSPMPSHRLYEIQPPESSTISSSVSCVVTVAVELAKR